VDTISIDINAAGAVNDFMANGLAKAATGFDCG
jgi:hypothetical protein